MRFWLISCCLCSIELLEEISVLFCLNPPPSEVKSKNSSLRNTAEQLPGLIISMPGSSAPMGPQNPWALPRCLLGFVGKGMPPPHCWLDPPSPVPSPTPVGCVGWDTVGWPRLRCQQGTRAPSWSPSCSLGSGVSLGQGAGAGTGWSGVWDAREGLARKMSSRCIKRAPLPLPSRSSGSSRASYPG